MKKSLFILFILLMPMVLATQIDNSVKQAFDNGENEVSVIVVLDEPNVNLVEEKKKVIKEEQEEVIDKVNNNFLGVRSKENLEVEKKFSLVNGFSANVTKEGLKKLKKNSKVKAIYKNNELHAFMSDTISLLNANDIWNITINGLSINGSDEAVCVIDTGINYSHPAFGSCSYEEFIEGNCSKVIGGYDVADNDDNPMDYNGHGSHVSGTIASMDSIYSGIAKGSKIVAVKAFAGSLSSTSDANVLSAMEWCINNATKYNITSISMSLGGGQFTSYCDDIVNSQYKSLIDQAVSMNISVVVATGNTNGNYPNSVGGISYPSCIKNATRVTSTTKSDTMSSFAFRHRNFSDIIAAPGQSILSVDHDTNGFRGDSGTSMATPHVSASFAVVRQYWRLAYNKIPGVKFIEKKIRRSGVNIVDVNSINYSRIDLLAVIRPYVNYTNTNINNNSKLNVTYVFVNITSDVDLNNSILEWNYPNGTSINITMNMFNRTNFYYNITNLKSGLHTYRVIGNDSIILGYSKIRSLWVDTYSPYVYLETINNTNLTYITFNVTDNLYLILNCNVYVDGVINYINNTVPVNVSVNVTLNNLSQGFHNYYVYCVDESQNYNVSLINTLFVDTVAPNVTFVSPVNGSIYSSSLVVLNVSLRDSGIIDTVKFNITNSTGSFILQGLGLQFYRNATINTSKIVDGEITVTAIVNDTFGNINDTEFITLFIDKSLPEVELINPNNLTNTTNRTIVFLYNVSDSFTDIKNCSLYINGLLNMTDVNVTQNLTQTFLVDLPNDNYNWSVGCFDSVDNFKIANNKSINILVVNPYVTLDSPIDLVNITGFKLVNFTCSAVEDLSLSNVTLYGNWSSKWHANITKSVNGTFDEVIFSMNLSDGVYKWNCLFFDNNSNLAFAKNNYTVIVDKKRLNISNIDEDVTETSVEISWETNEYANSSIEYGTSVSLGLIEIDSSYETSHSISIFGLDSSTVYYYQITNCDLVGNCKSFDIEDFTTISISTTSPASSSGGGGGGGGSSKNKKIKEVKISNTKNTNLVKDQTINVKKGTKNENQINEGIKKSFKVEKSKPLVVEFKEAVKKVTIKTKNDLEIDLDVEVYEEPKDVSALPNVFKYIKVNTDLKAEDLDSAEIDFIVDKKWIEENNYNKKEVVLFLYENKWIPLETSLISEEGNVLSYHVSVPHFSYFAISAFEEKKFFEIVKEFFNYIKIRDLVIEKFLIIKRYLVKGYSYCFVN